MNLINFLQTLKLNWKKKIPNASKPLGSYITKANTSMESQQLLANELKDVFLLLKINKSRP